MEKFEKLHKQLHEGIVKFTYTKKNGEVREAVGTLMFEAVTMFGGNIPEGKKVRAENVQTYYDIEKQAWRCFDKGRVVSIDGFTEFDRRKYM